MTKFVSVYEKYTALAASAEATAMLPSLTERELTILLLSMPQYSEGVISPLNMDEANAALRIRTDFFPPTYFRDGWETLPTARLKAKLTALSDQEVNLLFARVVWWLEQPATTRSQPIAAHFKVAKDSSVKSGGSTETADWNSGYSLSSWSLADAKKLCRRCPHLLESLFCYLGKEELTLVMCRMTDLIIKFQAASGEHWTKGIQQMADKGADIPSARFPKDIIRDFSPERLGPGMCFKLAACYLDHTEENIHEMEFWDLFQMRDDGMEIRIDHYVAAYALLGTMVKRGHTALSTKSMAQLVNQLVS